MRPLTPIEEGFYHCCIDICDVFMHYNRPYDAIVAIALASAFRTDTVGVLCGIVLLSPTSIRPYLQGLSLNGQSDEILRACRTCRPLHERAAGTCDTILISFLSAWEVAILTGTTEDFVSRCIVPFVTSEFLS